MPKGQSRVHGGEMVAPLTLSPASWGARCKYTSWASKNAPVRSFSVGPRRYHPTTPPTPPPPSPPLPSEPTSLKPVHIYQIYHFGHIRCILYRIHIICIGSPEVSVYHVTTTLRARVPYCSQLRLTATTITA
eukprot:643386-Prorocentrum_minimum.AAC.2